MFASLALLRRRRRRRVSHYHCFFCTTKTCHPLPPSPLTLTDAQLTYTRGALKTLLICARYLNLYASPFYHNWLVTIISILSVRRVALLLLFCVSKVLVYTIFVVVKKF